MPSPPARRSRAGWTAPTTPATARAWSRPPATTAPRTPSSPSWSGCRRGRRSSGSVTSSERWATRPRPERGGAPSGPSGLGALLVPVLLVPVLLGDLLRAAPAEQPRAGKALHHLAQVLHGVEQVVHVLAEVSHRRQHRQHVLVQGRDQLRQPVHQRHQRLDLV